MSEGRLIRRLLPFERNYTTIPNAWVRDSRLSPQALGILVVLLSHNDGWKITLQQLASDRQVGVDRIRSAVNELERSDYLIRRNTRRGLPDDWELTDPTGVSDPALFGVAGLRAPVDKSRSGKSNAGRTALENPTRSALENPTLKETQLRNNSLPSATPVARRSPVEKDASGGSLRPASAMLGYCTNGHPYIGTSGGGVPFCSLGCTPPVTGTDTRRTA